jgi:DNA repair exonuclease SbcCD nuclease subunit
MDESQTIRVSVEEAASLLGIEKGSVKKRIQRGKLRSEKDANGTIWVYVDRAETVRDKSAGQSHTDRDELVAELRRTNELLREVITTRDEEIRRRDVIISQLTSRIPELEAPPEARESPESSGPTGELGELREERDTERTRREMAESTLHEGMAEEQRRREDAERERDDLRRELFALRGTRESPKTVEQQGRGQPHSDAPGVPDAVQRPWWRRVFGRGR